MIVFKTFLKVLNKCKVPIIMYTVILIFFGAYNMQTSETTTSFVASKPDICIINNDNENKITENLMKYIQDNSNIVEIEGDDEAINDAIFYRDVNYVIYIPNNYGKDFLDGKDPKIEVKSTGDYQASFAEMMLTKYIKTANSYLSIIKNEDELIEKINETLSKQTEISVTSKLDTDNLAKSTFYYNFLSYSLLAGGVYVVCFILSSFKEEKVRKRTIISSMNYKEYNRKLLLSNSLFALILWGIYVVMSFILIGNTMYTTHGIMYIINSLIFAMCALTIAFFIGNLVTDKNAINGIVNVVALRFKFFMWSICTNGIFT